MVSLWPWKGDANSPASFEKALSSLAEKIAKSQSQLDSLRQRGRRLKALWTLYAIFAYLLCAVVLVLVVGWKNWTAVEYTGISASPLIIYIIRQGINTYYTYRIDTITQRLEDQQAERTKTIDKLKAATKYNSTQELLEKYGGATPAAKPKKPSRTPSTKSSKPIRAQLQRTGTGPPPLTANIPRPGQNQIPTPIQPSTPVQFPQVPSHSFQNAPLPPQNAPSPVGHAEFAPNAFSAPPQYAQGGEINTGGNWYDRILDLLMGDDETSPKNRIALICQNCRLVNGQAPPGTKNPSELRWRCFGCGGWNGEEDEGKKVVQEIKERIEQEVRPGSENDEEIAGDEDGGRSDGEDKEKSGEEVFETESTEDVVEVKAKRGRPKSGKKKA